MRQRWAWILGGAMAVGASQIAIGGVLFFDSLGWSRRYFGNPYPYPKTDREEIANYSGGIMGATDELFPVGRADRRYFFQAFDNSEAWLVLATKKGSKVKVEWMVRLRRFTTTSAYQKSRALGTLGRFISDRGWEVKPPIPTNVLGSLRTVKPYAHYRAAAAASKFYYGFVRTDGKLHQELSWAVDIPSGPVPPDGAYPISPDEMKYMESMRRKR